MKRIGKIDVVVADKQKCRLLAVTRSLNYFDRKKLLFKIKWYPLVFPRSLLVNYNTVFSLIHNHINLLLSIFDDSQEKS